MSLDVDKKKRLNLDMKVKKGKFGKMRRVPVMVKVNGLAPKNIDYTGKEEDVEDDDDDGGDGEEDVAVPGIHPARLILVPNPGNQGC